jgi:hypothetical protein
MIKIAIDKTNFITDSEGILFKLKINFFILFYQFHFTYYLFLFNLVRYVSL